MKDKKLKLRDLHALNTLGSGGDWPSYSDSVTYTASVSDGTYEPAP